MPAVYLARLYRPLYVRMYSLLPNHETSLVCVTFASGPLPSPMSQKHFGTLLGNVLYLYWIWINLLCNCVENHRVLIVFNFLKIFELMTLRNIAYGVR